MAAVNLTRRVVLGLFGALPFYRPSLAAPVRKPYVQVDEWVDSIIWHLWDDPRNPAPTGPLYVSEIKEWDGIGYPITLTSTGWRIEDRVPHYGFYDFEWVNFRRELPDRFWADPSRVERYPNVHSYIREKRFGEHPSAMRDRMEFNQLHCLKEQQASRLGGR